MKVLSATVSEQAGHWSVSVQVQVQVQQDHAVPVNTGPVVGVDLGIMTLATCSDGTVCANPRHLKRRLKKLKWYPSSTMCSGCGWVDDHLTLADRVFRCHNAECGQVLDRDLNAALNLATLATLATLAGSASESRNACGAASAGRGLATPVELAVRKQVSDTFDASVANGKF